MPGFADDLFLEEQSQTRDISELKDCAIGVDASYYLRLFLDKKGHEPLLPALGAHTGFENHIDADLDCWKENNVTPFFVFDGLSLKGQDAVAAEHGQSLIRQTDAAWELYFEGKANEAVENFGKITGVVRPQSLYPLLKNILRNRGLHFLVAPFNASAQLGYLDMIDSDQIAGVMGSYELLLYPINDGLIRDINWEKGTVAFISKRSLLVSMRTAVNTFVDAMLMSGTTFLPPFPPLIEGIADGRQPTVQDAVNLLRTTDKSIENAMEAYSDVIKKLDENWKTKYMKARLAVNYFIYISESGELVVHDSERLTSDNHEYLGLQLPAELFHYLNTGLIGPRFMSWIAHGVVVVQPTLDGVATDEYKDLVTKLLVPVQEQTLALVIPRLHRGIQHKEIKLQVWFDPSFSHAVNRLGAGTTGQQSLLQRVSTWETTWEKVMAHWQYYWGGPLKFEISTLGNQEFVKQTFAEGKPLKGIASSNAIISITIWRFLYLRGYSDDGHNLTPLGTALSLAYLEISDSSNTAGLDEAIFLAFELIRMGILNGSTRHEELKGLPMHGSDEDKASLMLVCRCATLLKLQSKSNGYTGPLNKTLLAFRSLANAVRDSYRDLTEAVLASMFLHGQAKRDRDDQLQIYLTLPFLHSPDVGMGIAVKTWLDVASPDDCKETKGERMTDFLATNFPEATHFDDDLQSFYAFFDALAVGVSQMPERMLPTGTKTTWERATEFLRLRR